MHEDEISRSVIGAAIETHRTLGGPGLLESIYAEALVWEIRERKLHVEREKLVPIHYKSATLRTPLRLDLLIEGKVIVEVKATQNYNAIYESQALTYLRLTGLRLALVINFGEATVREGIHRVVNRLDSFKRRPAHTCPSD